MANTAVDHFAKSINDHAELFASTSSAAAEPLQAEALTVVQSLLNPHIASEKVNLPLFQSMLSTVNSTRPTTRSASKKKAAQQNGQEPQLLQATPLSSLFVPAEDPDELVWQQMCLRLDNLQDLLGHVLGRPQDLGEEAASDPELEDGEGGQQIEDDSEDDDEDSLSDSESDTSEASSLDEAEAVETTVPLNTGPSHSSSPPPPDALSPVRNSSQPASKKSRGKPSPVDDAFFKLSDFLSQSDAGEAEMAKRLDKQKQENSDSEDEEDEDDVDLFAAPGQDEDEDGLEGEDLADADHITYNDFFAPPSGVPPPTKKSKIPAAAESSTASAQAATADKERPRSVRFHDTVRVKPIRARKNAGADDGEEGSLFQRLLAGGPMTEQDFAELERLGVDPTELLEDMEADGAEEGEEEDSDGDFDEEEGRDDFDAMEQDEDAEEDGDMDEDVDDVEMDGQDEDDGEQAMDRLKSDLFDDDSAESDGSDAEAEDPSLSRYERRQRALSRQIAQLESENVGKKDWVLSGEARARDRPLNSLLEEDLEFEHTGKFKPTVTTESVASLEERIKARILGNDWDDVERKLPLDLAKLAPSRLMDVSAEQGKSLAEVFEAQHLAATGQGEDVDEPTKKKHQEISELFDGICTKLDALSNARYTPKAPQTNIQSTSNVSAVSMEEAQPTATASSTLLAPEEVFAAQKAQTASKGEMDSSEKRSVRRKNRRARAATQKRVQDLVDQKSGGKEQARKELIGHRGVTVLGKGSAKKGGKLDKKSQRVGAGEASGQSYKL